MSKDDDNPGGFVTRSECNRITGETRGELTIIKNALVGEDLRHGLVKEVGDIKRDTCSLKKILNAEQKKVAKKQELAMRYKLTIYGAVGTSVTLIVVKILEIASTLL